MKLNLETSVDAHSARGARQMDGRGLALLSLSHLSDDIFQGAIPILIPFFIVAHNLSYAEAGGLMLAMTVSSSVVQPFLGQFSDRHSAPWLVPAGLLLAGSGVALSCLMPTYLSIALAIGACGIGVAAFHPEAARFANYAGGPRQATAMSIFSLGGNLGLATGPLLATPLLLIFGLRGGVFLFVPTALMALVMARQIPRFVSGPRGAIGSSGAAHKAGKDHWGPFARLTGVIISRSVLFYGLDTFIPLYWQDVLHQPVAAGSMALTILFVFGAGGTLLGGWLADRYGRRRVVLVSMAVLGVMLAAFVSVRDPLVATLLLVPIGMALFAPGSVMVVMGQEYLPNRIGTASGVTQGLALSMGGLAAPLLGQIADLNGIPAVLTLLAFVPLVAIAFGATLPSGKRAAVASSS
jgi:FSR family fosmidomycin resistance protein-like MFS transporter